MDKKTAVAVDLSELLTETSASNEAGSSGHGAMSKLVEEGNFGLRDEWSEQRLDISTWRLGDGQTTAEDAVTIDMRYADLCPNDSGEVIFEVDASFRFAIKGASAIADHGVCAANQRSSDGSDVSSYKFVVLDDGVTIYYPEQVMIEF